MQSNNSSLIIIPFILLFFAVIIVANWKIYQKAGQPGWAAIVPFYNLYVLFKITGIPMWWFLLFLIPLANIFVVIQIALKLAKSFGKSAVFGIVALLLFSPVGYSILGFGKAQYLGPGGAPAPTPSPAVPLAPTQTPTPPPTPTNQI